MWLWIDNNSHLELNSSGPEQQSVLGYDGLPVSLSVVRFIIVSKAITSTLENVYYSDKDAPICFLAKLSLPRKSAVMPMVSVEPF